MELLELARSALGGGRLVPLMRSVQHLELHAIVVESDRVLPLPVSALRLGRALVVAAGTGCAGSRRRRRRSSSSGSSSYGRDVTRLISPY